MINFQAITWETHTATKIAITTEELISVVTTFTKAVNTMTATIMVETTITEDAMSIAGIQPRSARAIRRSTTPLIMAVAVAIKAAADLPEIIQPLQFFDPMNMSSSPLFQPYQLKSLKLKNRIVMAPMTRSFSPDGVPPSSVADYYVQRAEGEVGLILSEGTVVNRPASSNDPNVPRFYGEKPLLGWKGVIDKVHAAGGAMAPQLWHMGVVAPHASGWLPAAPFEGPSGLVSTGKVGGVAMSESDIADTIRAFAEAAAEAKAQGFNAVELHGAHGYLIDQYFWHVTNQRTDGYGGNRLIERSRFARELIIAVREAVGPDFVISLRISQWKLQDYTARLVANSQEMEAWLLPLVDAGVDIFHCSQRRFWEPEFPGSDLNFAGWVKKMTGKPTITVGSVGLSGDFLAAFAGESSSPRSLDELIRRFDRGDFDLVAVGRPLLADAQWTRKIREGRSSELRGFTKEVLTTLS